MYVSNRTESSEHLPPREHESAAGENAAPLTLFDSDVKVWRKRRNVFGGGRNHSRTEQSALMAGVGLPARRGVAKKDSVCADLEIFLECTQ